MTVVFVVHNLFICVNTFIYFKDPYNLEQTQSPNEWPVPLLFHSICYCYSLSLFWSNSFCSFLGLRDALFQLLLQAAFICCLLIHKHSFSIPSIRKVVSGLSSVTKLFGASIIAETATTYLYQSSAGQFCNFCTDLCCHESGDYYPQLLSCHFVAGYCIDKFQWLRRLCKVSNLFSSLPEFFSCALWDHSRGVMLPRTSTKRSSWHTLEHEASPFWNWIRIMHDHVG